MPVTKLAARQWQSTTTKPHLFTMGTSQFTTWSHFTAGERNSLSSALWQCYIIVYLSKSLAEKLAEHFQISVCHFAFPPERAGDILLLSLATCSLIKSPLESHTEGWLRGGWGRDAFGRSLDMGSGTDCGHLPPVWTKNHKTVHFSQMSRHKGSILAKGFLLFFFAIKWERPINNTKFGTTRENMDSQIKLILKQHL